MNDINISTGVDKKKDLVQKVAAVFFLYNDNLSLDKISNFLNVDKENIVEIQNAISDLNNRLDNIGLTIVKTDNKNEDRVEYSISVKSDFVDIARSIRKDELEGELTPASLQVLTICAYLGASTKNEISFIRGVQSSQSIRSLSARGLLKRIGERYSLSIEAIQKLGVTRLEELLEYEKIKADFKDRLRDVLKDEEDTEQ